MEKNYIPQKIESNIYQNWETNNYFGADANKKSDLGNWSLMIPPPNVTGSLHMGHAFQDTIMDSLTRYHRMKGYNTLWQPGTDHAGIATQMIVERQLEAKGVHKNDLGRDKFIEEVWQWKEKSGGTISKQLRRMGASADWQRERFTMDKQLSEAVTSVFIKLYKENLLYKGKRLVNWDPKFRTAISDLEVINIEEKGKLYYVRYPLVSPLNNVEFMLIATTRPETIIADGALAVHPDDQKYQHLIGQKVWVPLTERQIPIIADDYVDKYFGSGCVKITPAHDFNDYQVGQRHEIEVINLFTKDAHMNDNVPEKYRGLERFVARDLIVEDLQAEKLLHDIKNHTLKRPYGDRSGVVIEPYLTDQWFLSTRTLANRSIDVVKNNHIEFIPKNWENTYFQWLENIQDWCVSRQLWWGHRIPAWYDDNNNIYVAENTELAYQQARGAGYQGTLRQDEDVLDTWFSSALWPFSTLGWPNKTQELEAYYPTSVLVSGFDIIFFWIARMVMFGLHFTDKVPFKQVYIHGLVRDSKGQKMSKSKGNALDPLDIIDGIDLQGLIQKRTTGLMQPQKAKQITQDTKNDYPNGIPAYGCDALRFTFMAMASTGRDIRFNLSRCEGYRNFCNKLWNAARFCLMQIQNDTTENNTISTDCSPPRQIFNQWIESRLHSSIQEIEKNIKAYRFDLVSNSLYELVWTDFCNWYIELTKPSLKQENNQETKQILLSILEQICRLAHPIIPYITEEIWQSLPFVQEQKTIMLSPFPILQKQKINPAIETKIEWLQNIVTHIRSLRSQSNIQPNQEVSLCLENLNSLDKQNLQQFTPSIMNLCKLTKIQGYTQEQGFSSTTGHIKIIIPYAGNINLDQEKKRLLRELKKVSLTLENLDRKLTNPNYLDKAPQKVVDETVIKNREATSTKEQLQQALKALD